MKRWLNRWWDNTYLVSWSVTGSFWRKRRWERVTWKGWTDSTRRSFVYSAIKLGRIYYRIVIILDLRRNSHWNSWRIVYGNSSRFGVNVAVQFVVDVVIPWKYYIYHIYIIKYKFICTYPTFLSDDPQVEHLKHSTCKFLSLILTKTPLQNKKIQPIYLPLKPRHHRYFDENRHAQEWHNEKENLQVRHLQYSTYLNPYMQQNHHAWPWEKKLVRTNTYIGPDGTRTRTQSLKTYTITRSQSVQIVALSPPICAEFWSVQDGVGGWGLAIRLLLVVTEKKTGVC